MGQDVSSPTVMRVGNGELINVEGFICDRGFYDFVVRMKEYDENLELACLNPDMADFADEPFVILERCTDGKMRKVFGVWNLDQSVLDRIALCDTNRYDIIAQIDKENAARERDTLRRYKDKQEETTKLVERIVRNETSRYSYKDQNTGEKVTIFDDRPSKREGGY